MPEPRVNLTRFYGLFAPNSKHRVQVTPAKRGKGKKKTETPDEIPDQSPGELRAAMTLAQRLTRVVNIDIETCRACDCAVKVIASIEEPMVIEKRLTHQNEQALVQKQPRLLENRVMNPT